MSEFIYPTDLDLIYATESELVKQLPSVQNTTEESIMVNELGYTLSPSGTSGGLNVAASASNEDISQYQEVIVKANIASALFDNVIYDGFVVVLHISQPTVSTISDIDDFDYHIHLRPRIGVPGEYFVNLNEFLGRNLTIGTLNSCQFKFQILAKTSAAWDSYVQINTGTIGLYKTNLDYSTKADDLSNAFSVLSELNAKLQEEAS